MPSNTEVIDEIEKVKQIAQRDLFTLGIDDTLAGLEVCDIKEIPLEAHLEDVKDDATDEDSDEGSTTNGNGNAADEGCDDVEDSGNEGALEDLEEDIHILSGITGELENRRKWSICHCY